MSYTFSILAPTVPTYRAVFDRVGLPGLQFEEGEPPSGSWQEGYLHVYREGISTRSVEIALEDGRFEVRILSLTAPEDYELAFRLVEALAPGPATEVEPEDGDPFPVSELRRAYGAEWISGQIDSGVRVVAHMATERGEEAGIPGPIRTCYLGPIMVAALTAAGPPESLAGRVLEAIRRVQYVDPDLYLDATVMEIQLRDQGAVSCVIWGAGCGVIVPPVEYVLLPEGEDDDVPGEFLLAPRSIVPEIVGDRWSRLDERHHLIEPIEPHAWPALIARAREHGAAPLPPPDRRDR